MQEHLNVRNNEKKYQKYKQYYATYYWMKDVGERVFQKVPKRIKILTFVSCYIV